jgi:hypothetical protein
MTRQSIEIMAVLLKGMDARDVIYSKDALRAVARA